MGRISQGWPSGSALFDSASVQKKQQKLQEMPSPQTLILVKTMTALPEHQRNLIAEIVRPFDGKQRAGE